MNPAEKARRLSVQKSIVKQFFLPHALHLILKMSCVVCEVEILVCTSALL
jgi:hypothetical protein